ncbi:dnaJ homolog subfamily B member 9 [Ptiloglossa arizonensis]|uniref:dnaJ homolog subfamily B member 9 n=1 Tax=Ptiloglossa arizonensis TaxID=3350558 RepID=UPI003F9EBC92
MSIRSLKHFNKKIFAKLLWQRVFSYNMKVNMSTKCKTHYDTLEISPNATHNEIKSAYYKLTIQYHPDKNKSDSAKQIFQEISAAYEVLSNYKLRKQYDRTIAIRQGNVNVIQRPTKPYEANSFEKKNFDFDKWSHHHYGRQLAGSFERKLLYQQYLNYQKRQMKENESTKSTIKWSFFLGVTIFIVPFILERLNNYDIPLNEKPK